MREYETVFVLHPKVDEAGIEREIEGVKQTIAEGKGELVGVHKWGRKKLAYTIRDAHEGYYVLARFHADPEVLAGLDRRYKLNENILRHLTVRAAGEPFPPDLRGRERRGPRGGEGVGGRGGRRRSSGPPDLAHADDDEAVETDREDFDEDEIQEEDDGAGDDAAEAGVKGKSADAGNETP